MDQIISDLRQTSKLLSVISENIDQAPALIKKPVQTPKGTLNLIIPQPNICYSIINENFYSGLGKLASDLYGVVYTGTGYKIETLCDEYEKILENTSNEQLINLNKKIMELKQEQDDLILEKTKSITRI